MREKYTQTHACLITHIHKHTHKPIILQQWAQDTQMSMVRGVFEPDLQKSHIFTKEVGKK